MCAFTNTLSSLEMTIAALVADPQRIWRASFASEWTTAPVMVMMV